MALDETRLIVSIDSRNAERDARNITRELQNLERGGNQASSSMGSLSAATRSLAGYMGGLLTVAAAVNKMDVYTGLQNRLKLVTNSQTELNTAMNDTFAIAQKTASSWDSAAMVYQRFADNAVRLNITMKETAALTETVTKAISVSGGSAASAEAALMQFGQALASGVLRGEEFNSIAEQAPGLLKAIAFGLDTNVGSLRAMAAAGKITGDVLVQSLTKAQPYIDDLFNKTDFTISASFTKLSNEVTKFIGEAGKGSGAAAGLSDAISVLAENLGTIANIAVIGGVAMLTKAIATQTVAIYGSITASIARRSAMFAELGATAAASAAEVVRTGAIADHAAMQVLDAKATAARMTGMQKLAFVQSTLIPLEAKATQATAAHTAATTADTAVQELNNKARTRGAMLLAAVGGPIGAITIGVAALAAGYMYMSAKTAEATAKLAEQGRVADQTADDLKKLTGNDKKTAVTDLTSAFAAQNTELGKSKEAVDAVLFAIRASSVENEKARKVTEDAKAGTISYTQAVALLNKMDISPDLYVMLKKQALQYDENAGKASNTQRALSLLGVEVKLVGNNAQNAVVKIDSNTEAINKNETAADKAAKAQKNYADSLYDRYFDANFNKIILASGKTEGETKALLEAANYARKKGVEFTKEMANEALRLYKLESNVQDVLDKRKEAEKKVTQEKGKQLKVLEASAKVQENAAKYNFGGLESKYAIPKGTLSAIHAIETGNTGKTNQVNASSGATGGFQFLSGTAKKYGVKDRTDLAQSAEGAAKYIAYLLKLFNGNMEKAVRAYHAGEGNVKKGTNIGKFNNDYWSKFKGYSAGVNGYSDGDAGAKDWERQIKEAAKAAEDQAKLRKSLELEVANEVTKIRENLKDKLEEIDGAGFDAEKTKSLKAEYTARADNEIAISQYVLKTKLSDYEAFTKDESQLLRESFDEKKFYAARDIELSNEQKTQALVLLDRQLKEELQNIQDAMDSRIFQYKEAMMTETQVMQERYRLERDEILKTANAAEMAAKLAAFNESTIRGGVGKNFSDPNDMNSQFLKSASYTAIPKTNTEKLDEDYAKTLQKLTDNLNAVKDAENASYEERLEAKRVFDEAKQQMDDEYYFKTQDARKSDHENQLGFYSQMLGQASTVWGSMTQMVKDAKGENSKTFKAMFLAQQAMAIAQQIINTELAAGATTAQTGIFGLPAATAIRAVGYASVGMIAAQTIAGFETGGYTGSGGRKDIAGVVHGQEFVLNAAATKRVGVDTLNAVNSGKGDLGGGGAVVQPIINIHTLAGETAEVTTNEDGSIDVRIRKVVGDYMQAEFSNQNSKTSQSLKQNFNIAPKR